jgi:hypothetical protein
MIVALHSLLASCSRFQAVENPKGILMVVPSEAVQGPGHAQRPEPQSSRYK